MVLEGVAVPYERGTTVGGNLLQSGDFYQIPLEGLTFPNTLAWLRLAAVEAQRQCGRVPRFVLQDYRGTLLTRDRLSP